MPSIDKKPHTIHVGHPFLPELPSKGASNSSHLLSPWPFTAACSLFQDIRWWIPITFLTHCAIQRWSKHGKPTKWSPNMNQICIHVDEHQYSRLGVVCTFATGTYSNMESGCYYHQIGWTTYMYMTPFSKWPPAKWNYVFAYNSASRIDRDNILLTDEVISLSLCKLPSSIATWAGINGPWNHRGWSLPSLVVHRGPAVTHNKSQLMDRMNEVLRCLCSKVCAEKGVVSNARWQLLEWWWDNNKYIYMRCIWTSKRHISLLPCAVPIRKSRVWHSMYP